MSFLVVSVLKTIFITHPVLLRKVGVPGVWRVIIRQKEWLCLLVNGQWNAQWKGEEDKADRRRGGKTASGNGQARSSPSPRGQWRTEWRKLVVKSSVVPQQPSRLWDRWGFKIGVVLCQGLISMEILRRDFRGRCLQRGVLLHQGFIYMEIWRTGDPLLGVHLQGNKKENFERKWS